MLWPNPVSETLKISSVSPLSRIVVYSINGTKIKELTLPGTETSGQELFWAICNGGNYLIQVIQQKGES